MDKIFDSVVYPLNDVRPHIDSLYCACKPEIRDRVLIHNAFDGRHLQENYDLAIANCTENPDKKNGEPL